MQIQNVSREKAIEQSQKGPNMPRAPKIQSHKGQCTHSTILKEKSHEGPMWLKQQGKKLKNLLVFIG